MVAAGLVAGFLAIPAEQRSLEDIAEPLSARAAAASASAHGPAGG
ncbi:hypothetical protein GCM10017744_019940 [Streptomyces antimycoticus]